MHDRFGVSGWCEMCGNTNANVRRGGHKTKNKTVVSHMELIPFQIISNMLIRNVLPLTGVGSGSLTQPESAVELHR